MCTCIYRSANVMFGMQLVISVHESLCTTEKTYMVCGMAIPTVIAQQRRLENSSCCQEKHVPEAYGLKVEVHRSWPTKQRPNGIHHIAASLCSCLNTPAFEMMSMALSTSSTMAFLFHLRWIAIHNTYT